MAIDKPLVTVFMAVYNGESYIREAIESVLSQSFSDFELLIINDGSSDGSLEQIESYKDSRIRVLNNATNKGLFYTRNRGIDEALGTYFATLDCDDIAYPHRLKEQMTYFIENPECALCGGKARVIDGDSKATGKIVPPIKGAALPAYMFFNNAFINSSTIIKTEVVREFRFRPNYEPAEDYDLFSRIAEKYKIVTLNSMLVKYREHGNNVSQKKAESKKKGELAIIDHNLRRIGIAPSSKDLDIHHLFISKKFKQSSYTRKQIEDHLLKLKAANDNCGIFEQRHFNQALMWHWTLVSVYMGLNVAGIFNYFKSPLFLRRFSGCFTVMADLIRFI